MIEFQPTIEADADALIDVRIAAMRESLERVGRFSPERARERFLNSFVPENTFWIVHGQERVGFYALQTKEDHFYLDHLYILPEHQGKQLGSQVLQILLEKANQKQWPIRLGALKESASNRFYQRHGFKLTHEEEWDLYYEFLPRGVETRT